MRCYNCKAEISDDIQICPKCGSPQKFTDLVERAKNGDQDATTQLYKMTYNNVSMTVRSVAPLDEDTAFDIMQNTYVKAFHNLSQLKEPEAFRGWIKTISRNLTIDYLRKKKVVLFSQMVSTDSDEAIEFEDERTENLPDIVIDQKETRRLVDEILSGLPEEQRIIITMHFYEQLSVKEIAEILGISEGTVKSRINYGKKKIRVEVEALEKKGTKLYGLAPIPFLLLLLKNQEVYAAEQPNMDLLQSIQSELSATSSVQPDISEMAGQKTAASTAAKSAASTAGKTISTKVIAGVIAVAVVGAGAAGIMALNKNNQEPVEIVETTDPEEGVDETEITLEEVEEAYQGILDDYVAACENGFNLQQYPDVSQEAMMYFESFGAQLLYNYRDIDNNGVYELIIGQGENEAIRLGAVYSYDGDKAIKIYDNFNERTQVQLMKDGSIYENGAGSATTGVVSMYQLNEDGYTLDTVFSYEYAYTENGVTYSNDEEELTEAEFQALLEGKKEVDSYGWYTLYSKEEENSGSIAGTYVRESDQGVTLIISEQDANTLLVQSDYSGNSTNQSYEAVKDGDSWVITIDLPSGTATMTVTQEGNKVRITGNDIYKEHALISWEGLYASQTSEATNTNTVETFAGAYINDTYCFELIYNNGELSCSSGELPYGGMFSYLYSSYEIEGNVMMAKHDEGTDIYTLNEDGSMDVVYEGPVNIRSGLYQAHKGTVF